MPMEIQWTLTVEVPQLTTLEQTLAAIGRELMERLDAINAAIVELGTQQAAGSEAIAAQLTAIADEISQLNAGAITTEELTELEAKIRQAAATAEQQAAAIRTNTQQITTIVPETPPA